jgi:hypothetical protein
MIDDDDDGLGCIQQTWAIEVKWLAQVHNIGIRGGYLTCDIWITSVTP